MTNTHYAEYYSPKSFDEHWTKLFTQKLPFVRTGWNRVIDAHGNVAVDFLPTREVALRIAAKRSLDPLTPGGR